MSNGAMTQARLDEIRASLGELARREETGELEDLLRELIAALEYERGVCTTQASVIKDLRQELERSNG